MLHFRLPSTCLYRILFQFIWLFVFLSLPFSTRFASITSYSQFISFHFLLHLLKCFMNFFPGCSSISACVLTELKEIDMNNSFIATNEILWMQNPYKLFLVVLLSRCYHRLFVYPGFVATLRLLLSLFFKFCVRKKLWRHWRRQYQRFSNETLCYLVFWKKDKVFFSA